MKSAYIESLILDCRIPEVLDRIFASDCKDIEKIAVCGLYALPAEARPGKPNGPDRDTDAATPAIRFETILCA